MHFYGAGVCDREQASARNESASNEPERRRRGNMRPDVCAPLRPLCLTLAAAMPPGFAQQDRRRLQRAR